MPNPRILHLMQCTYLGGTEQTLYALMRGLHGRAYDFRIASMHPPGDGAPLMTSLGIPVLGHQYRGRFGWRTHHQLRRTIASQECDLVLASGPTLSGSVAVRHARSNRRVLTVHYHHGTDRLSRMKWGAFYREFGRDYARITFLTDFIRREAEAVAPQLADRFQTVRAPVDMPAPLSAARRAEIRRNWSLPADVPVVANAGQLIPRKRWDVFLDVAARVARDHGDVHYHQRESGTRPAGGALSDPDRRRRHGRGSGNEFRHRQGRPHPDQHGPGRGDRAHHAAAALAARGAAVAARGGSVLCGRPV